MLFNTVQYILFLLLVVTIYYFLPRKYMVRNIWLLSASYFFYMQWNALYVLLLFFCTLTTFIAAWSIEKIKTVKLQDVRQRKALQKVCMVICISLNLLILTYFKYFGFGISCLNQLLAYIHVGEIRWNHDILLPVGISFYSLQALGYLIDVYRGDIKAEKNFVNYALFVSFSLSLSRGQ